MADLVFRHPAGVATNDLVFGTDDAVATQFDLVLSGAFAPMTLAARLAPVFKLALTGVFAETLTCTAVVGYATNTQRPTVGKIAAFAKVAQPAEQGVAQPQQHAKPTQEGVQHRAAEAVYAHAGNTPAFANGQATEAASIGQFQDGVGARAALFARWQDGRADMRGLAHCLFKDGLIARGRLDGRFQDGLHDRRPSRTTRWSDAEARAKPYTGKAGPGTPAHVGRNARYQEAWVARPGQYVRPVTPVVPPEYWGTALVFRCPPLALPNLVFSQWPCGVDPNATQALLYILPARFYMTAHTIFAQTLPDLVDVPIFDATLAADSGSYCWTLQASGPASLFEQLAPVGGLPAQIKVTLDGIPWVFAVDALARTKSFGQSGVRVQGRSVTALLSAPYLRATTRNNASAMTAQQLALDALAGTGVALDWGVGAGALANGGLVDWLVSAGAWSHQGTPLDAVQAIVQTAGGYLQSHRSAATLQARHPYGQRVGDASGAPWAWGTGAADVELATDALITEAVQRQDGPDINAVYVSGTSAGVLALVKRTGTAADKLSAMVTDPLMTHTDAARQRGLSILGAAGHKYAVSLDLPVLIGAGQPGVLDVGQLVQVNTSVPWRGRVRGVSVQAKLPTLRQTVTLERHLETA